METIKEEEELVQKSEKYVYIDLQGFLTIKGKFIVKEICLLDIDDNMFHEIIKSPNIFEKMPHFYRKQAVWLKNFFHGLSFEDGDISLSQMVDLIYPKLEGKTVIVKGVQKIQWLKRIFKMRGDINCLNIEDLVDNETMKQSIDQVDDSESCTNHKHLLCGVCHCARKTVKRIKRIHIALLNGNFKLKVQCTTI